MFKIAVVVLLFLFINRNNNTSILLSGISWISLFLISINSFLYMCYLKCENNIRNIESLSESKSIPKSVIWNNYINLTNYFLAFNYIIDIFIILSIFLYFFYSITHIQDTLILGAVLAFISRFDAIRYSKYSSIKLELKKLNF